MTPNTPAVLERGENTIEGFGTREIQTQHEISMAAIAAREQAVVQSEYVMAERHPRVWMDVRGQMLSHCSRPRFAEVARYAKPVGSKFVNGEWVEQFARGFSARFAETLCQEMANIKPFTVMTYDDDAIRILRFGVVDLQKNIIRWREVTFAKSVERKGKKIKNARAPRDYNPERDWSQLWEPPDRELVNPAPRINSYGDPVWLVKATDDELRNKVNSEESKTQRDFILKLCPRDILEDCEFQILTTLEKEVKEDPLTAAKRLIDRFKETYGLRVSDLQSYVGKEFNLWGANELRQLRELGVAIKEGQTTFDEAMKAKQQAGEKPATDEEKKAVEERVKQAEAANKQPETKGPDAETKPAASETKPAASETKPAASETNDKPIVNVNELPDAFVCEDGDRARLPDGRVCQVIEGGWKVIQQAPPKEEAPKEASAEKKPITLPKRR